MASHAVRVTGAYVGVQGMGLVDVIANWSLMTQPRAMFSPRDIRMMAANIEGRLDSMIADADERASGDSGLPSFAPSQFHRVIWSAAAVHWTTHSYRVAVREAAEALTLHWKTTLGARDGNATTFWDDTLSATPPKVGSPRLVWPGDDDDRSVQIMRKGLGPLARGLNQVVRNTSTHSQSELTEQEAMERLGAYSCLAHMLDRCEIRLAEEP